ncbi:MAG: hypothetical protein QF666_07055 [Alphaproteobacteria bacterium]|nr:hypothetical protein [Alphaproteobacteria bacterium]MDP6589187.1 hypothetical protein [Alphaproteobacteria bacterium]
MSELCKNGPDGAARDLDSGGGEDLAELLSTLDENSFIPVAALGVAAEILTYLHRKDRELATVENEI